MPLQISIDNIPRESIDNTSKNTTGLEQTALPLALQAAVSGLEPIPESTHTYVYYDNLPFYENWPPPKQYPPPVRPRLSLQQQQQQHAYLGKFHNILEILCNKIFMFIIQFTP